MLMTAKQKASTLDAARIPQMAGYPVVCSRCGVVWPAERRELRSRFVLELDPALCPDCATLAIDERRAEQALDPLRCRCLGCWGHNGPCTEKVHESGAMCRGCGQWTTPKAHYRPAHDGCVRCDVEVREVKLLCDLCWHEFRKEGT